MKNFLLLISLCLCSAVSNAKTYYISTTGNDNNAGTISAPFKTWERISAPRWSNLLQPGDIVYIRGGLYTSPHANDGVSEAVFWSGINGSSSNYITIQNYPGEQPILDCGNMTNANSSWPTKWIIYMGNCSYVKVKGLHIQNLRQILDGSSVSRGFGNIVVVVEPTPKAIPDGFDPAHDAIPQAKTLYILRRTASLWGRD